MLFVGATILNHSVLSVIAVVAVVLAVVVAAIGILVVIVRRCRLRRRRFVFISK